MSTMRYIITALAACVGVAYIGALAFGEDEHPTSPGHATSSQGQERRAPMAAFRRPAAAADELPPQAREGVTRMSPQRGQSRRLRQTPDRDIFAEWSGGDTLCLATVERQSDVTRVTCKAVEGLGKGHLIGATSQAINGLVPDGVSEVQFLDDNGEVLTSVAAENGAYTVDGMLGKAARLRFNDGAVETLLDLPSPRPGFPPATG